MALKICCLLVFSFSLPSEAVTKVAILPIFSQDCRYFYCFSFFFQMNNEPAFDNFSSTVLVVFLKFLLFPTSFFSAIEKINHKNIVHFKYFPSFLSLTFRHIHSKKTVMDCCTTIATNSPSRICVTQILHCTVQQRHDT